MPAGRPARGRQPAAGSRPAGSRPAGRAGPGSRPAVRAAGIRAARGGARAGGAGGADPVLLRGPAAAGGRVVLHHCGRFAPPRLIVRGSSARVLLPSPATVCVNGDPLPFLLCSLAHTRSPSRSVRSTGRTSGAGGPPRRGRVRGAPLHERPACAVEACGGRGGCGGPRATGPRGCGPAVGGCGGGSCLGRGILQGGEDVAGNAGERLGGGAPEQPRTSRSSDAHSRRVIFF